MVEVDIENINSILRSLRSRMSQMFCFLGIEPLTKDDSVKSYVQTVIDSFGHAKKNKL